MRADVLFDSLAAALDIVPKFRRSSATKAVDLFEGGRHDTFNSYFFTTFGQSRRESVCACEDKSEANLSQALHLINGQTIDHALQRNPKLIPYLIDQYESPQQIVEAIFIRALSRKPSETELSGILKTIPETEDRAAIHKAYNNVMWGVLNSSEFMFNH